MQFRNYKQESDISFALNELIEKHGLEEVVNRMRWIIAQEEHNRMFPNNQIFLENEGDTK